MSDLHTPYSLSDWINYLSHDEIDLLSELAKQLPPNPLVINIGAGVGTSALTLLSARNDLNLFTIDINYPAHPYGGIENELGILGRAGFYPSTRYDYGVGPSIEIGKVWTRPVNMVFVDGDHTYEGCRGDIEVWWKHLASGGVMAIHDYQKIKDYELKHPTDEITPELIWSVIKPYPGVDNAVKDTLILGSMGVDSSKTKTVHSLIAFFKS